MNKLCTSKLDITAGKQIEESLQQIQALSRAVLMSLPISIVVLDRQGTILTVNEAWLKFARENYAKSMGSVGPGENFIKICRQALDNGRDSVMDGLNGISSVLNGSSEYFEMEYPWDSPTETRWFQMQVALVKGENSEVIVVHNDITLRKMAEKNSDVFEERYRKLVEQSPMDIVILTPEGRISEVNAAWRQNWDVQPDEAAKVIEAYNIRTDSQFKEHGYDLLVEKAFAGEDVILPPIHYVPAREFDVIGVEEVVSRPRWLQCQLYSIKDTNGNVQFVVGINVDITERKQAENKLSDALEDIKALKDRLEAESTYLQDEIKLGHNFKQIIGESESLKYVLHRVEQVACTDSSVLIMGETGTGKELIARALHDLSSRKKRALVKVNCATLPRELIESELFGKEKGAYTGATAAQPGRFELAMGSTIFLDEIGELPIDIQSKLLRVIESGEFERLGSSRTLHSDARIIAATNRELEEEVRAGRFREDLWYRLKVFPITIPPVRERPEDIPLLVRWFVDQLAIKVGKKTTEITKNTMQKLQAYHWPGNVRELKHVVEAALIISQGKKLHFEIPQNKNTELTDFISFEAMERDYILRALKASNWKTGGKNGAAPALGMHVNTLRGRMKKLGIKKP